MGVRDSNSGPPTRVASTLPTELSSQLLNDTLKSDVLHTHWLAQPILRYVGMTSTLWQQNQAQVTGSVLLSLCNTCTLSTYSLKTTEFHTFILSMVEELNGSSWHAGLWTRLLQGSSGLMFSFVPTQLINRYFLLMLELPSAHLSLAMWCRLAFNSWSCCSVFKSWDYWCASLHWTAWVFYKRLSHAQSQPTPISQLMAACSLAILGRQVWAGSQSTLQVPAWHEPELPLWSGLVRLQAKLAGTDSLCEGRLNCSPTPGL